MKKTSSIAKRIVIDNDYVIDIDETNFTLKTNLGVDKKGNETSRILGYFSSMSSVLNKITKSHLLKNLKDENTLEDFKKTLDETSNYINTVCDKLRI